MKKLEVICPNEKQIETLFSLLKLRQHGISHSTLPSYTSHKKFVLENPYRQWYLAWDSGHCRGSIYVQHDNSIGINLVPPYNAETLGEYLLLLESDIQPLPRIASVRSACFFINVSPNNKELVKKLEILGYKISQVSYFLKK